MNATTSFDAPPSSSGGPSNALNFDYLDPSAPQTLHQQLSSLSDHLHTLSKLQPTTHPLSSTQPPLQNSIAPDLLSLAASLQNYHVTVSQLVQPINGDPIVLGAERFVGRLKEHAQLLGRLENRKRAIRLVSEDIDNVKFKRGDVRKDRRFTEKRIEVLLKDLGLLVYGADESSSEIPNDVKRLTVGGKLIVLDLDFIIPLNATPSQSSNLAPISKLTLSIAPADDEPIASLGPAAALVLNKNIDDQDGDMFITNLSNLAKWDGCSESSTASHGETGGINCFAVLKGVEDALLLIHTKELENAPSENDIISKGWGKPVRNTRNLVGLSILFQRELGTGKEWWLLLGVEPRRTNYVHPTLQTSYLLPENPFFGNLFDDMEPTTTNTFQGDFLNNETINWIEVSLDGDAMQPLENPTCSFIIDLDPPVIMSVEGAKKICEIVGYVGWTDVVNTVLFTLEENANGTSLEEKLFGDKAPAESTVDVILPTGSVKHSYSFVPILPISARSVDRIPFSHPRQIFPVLTILRQWAKFNHLLKSCFPESSTSTSNGAEVELTLEELLNGTASSTPSISISPIASPPSLLVIFPLNGERRNLLVSVLENGEIDVDTEEHLKERTRKLIEKAGLGVGIEFLRKELVE